MSSKPGGKPKRKVSKPPADRNGGRTKDRSHSKPRRGQSKSPKPPSDPRQSPPRMAEENFSISKPAAELIPPHLQGTVKGPNSQDFDPEAACEQLRKAFKGIGTDEKTIIEVLGSHTNWQRQEIKKKYKQMYGRDLLTDLEEEIGGHFLDLALALCCPSHLYDAHLIHKAINGTGTDEATLIEILCTRSNSELELIKEAYNTEFRRDLEKDIASEVGGDFGKCMKSVVTAARDENKELDMDLAEKDADKLVKAGIGKLGTDEEVFNRLLCLRSWPQLKATFDIYRRNTQCDIELDIRKEFSGDMLEALLTIVKVAKNPQAYFAEKMHEAMKGTGTDDEALIRIVVSRSEVDLAMVKEEFQRRFKQTLPKAIKDDCSGDYCRLMLKIVGQ